ncbi:MAG: hemolysin family protein [Dissulfurispiraceae bacterium]|jgi:putative hemolysin|nr:hemolysin family protein [Dissulfurispiraceae bacterium]
MSGSLLPGLLIKSAMLTDIVLISIFILINGFFAATELAVVSMRKSRIKQMVDEGVKNARVLSTLKEHPDRFLATIQIGVTLASALASAIGGAAAVKVLVPLLKTLPFTFISTYSEAISIFSVVVVITYFSLVFGELLPKSIALSNPEGVALYAAPLVNRFSRIGGLFVKFLAFSTNALLRPFGKHVIKESGHISEEEVKLLLEEGGQQGVFEPDEKELIHSVFEFTDTSVKEVMLRTPQIVAISLSMTQDQIKDIISDEKFSRYPVIGKDINDVRGVLYAKDFFNALLKSSSLDIKKIIKTPFFVPETMKVSILLREMQKKRIHLAIAIDEYGMVSGLVTLEDLIEEIVGEIRDEYDTDSPVITLPNGALIIDASTSIRDLIDEYELILPESNEYDTLGGLVLTSLQRMPQPGDMIEINNMKMRIVEMVGQRIAKVKLEKIEITEESTDSQQLSE